MRSDETNGFALAKVQESAPFDIHPAGHALSSTLWIPAAKTKSHEVRPKLDAETDWEEADNDSEDAIFERCRHEPPIVFVGYCKLVQLCAQTRVIA